jgi:hypothetical protein
VVLPRHEEARRRVVGDRGKDLVSNRSGDRETIIEGNARRRDASAPDVRVALRLIAAKYDEVLAASVGDRRITIDVEDVVARHELDGRVVEHRTAGVDASGAEEVAA